MTTVRIEGETAAIVAALDEQRHRAMIDLDLDALRDLLSPELIYTHAAGFVETRTENLAVLAAGAVRYRSMRRTLRAAVAGADWAVLQGQLDADVEVGGEPRQVVCWFTATWALEEGRWRMVAWAATPIASGITAA